jgi:pimeloyl-ACP methyl ester carboxylesterase
MMPTPTMTPAQAARAFLTPRPPKRRVPLQLPDARALRIATPEVELAAVVAGAGPTVLMVHGWEGQASDLSSIAHALIAQGHRVIVLDLPAHGASGGHQASIPAMARALLHAAPAFGALHAVVAHSVGTAVTITAMSRGLTAQRAVLLAAPARYADFVHRFATAVGLDQQGAAEMIERLLDEGVDVAQIESPRLVRTLTADALYVHSADDPVVPIADAQSACAAWPGAQLLQVDGLGHGRLLVEPTIVQAVVRFIAPLAARTPANAARLAGAL